MALKILNLIKNQVNFGNEISNQQYWSQRMNETYQPKRPSQFISGVSPNKSHNDPSQLLHINNELQQIAQRDHDVKSSIQNLKMKLNIYSAPEAFDVSYSSISMPDLCVNCNTFKAMLQTLKNHSTPLKEEIKIIALENAKLSRQNKKLQTKIREFEDQANHKLMQRQIDIDKENKLLVDFKMKDLECVALLKQNKSLTTNIEKHKNQVTELNRQMQSVQSLKQKVKGRQNTQIQKTVEMYVSMLKEKDEEFLSEKRRFEQHLASKQMQFKKIQERHMQLEDELKKQIQQKQDVIELLNRSFKTQFESQANIFNEKMKLKQNQYENLKSMFQNLKAELVTVKNDNVYMKQMISNYEIQLQQQTQLIQQYETKINQPFSKENNSIRRQFEQLKTQVQQSQRMEDDYLDKIEQLQSFYKNQLSINQGLTLNFKAVQEEKKRTLFENTHLKQLLDRALAKVKNIEYEKEMVERQLQKGVKKFKELTKNLDQSLEENKRMQQKIYFYENSSNKVQTEYRGALVNYQKKLQQSDKQISHMKETLRKKQNEKMEKVQSLQKQFMDVQSQFKQQKIQKKIELQLHARLNGELIMMRDLLNKKTEEFNSLLLKFQQAQKRLQRFEQQSLHFSKSLSQQRQQTKQLQRELKRQKNESQRLQQQKIVLKHQKQVYQSEIQMLKSSLKESSQTKRKQLEKYNKFQALRQQIVYLKDRSIRSEGREELLKEELRAKVKELEKANMKIELLNRNVGELEDKRKCKQGQLNSKGNEISQGQLEADSKIFELEINITELQEELKKQNLLSAQTINHLQAQLQQSLMQQTTLKENINTLMEALQEKESMISEEKLRHVHYVEEKERELEILKDQSQQKQELLQTNQGQEILKLNHDLMTMIENTSTLQVQLNILSNDNQNLFQDNKKLLNENIALKEQLDSLKKLMQKSLIEVSKEHQAREQKKSKEQMLQLEHAYQQIIHLEGNLMGQTNEISKLNSANVEILNQNRVLFDERRILINQKTQLQKEVQNLLEKLQQSNQQVQNSDQRLNSVQKSLKLKLEEFNYKEQSLMQLMSKLEQRQQKLNQKEKLVQTKIEQNEKLEIQLKTKLKEIEQKTIKLEQRTIQLKQNSDQIQLKAELLNQKEAKFRENQLSLEETLLNTKRVLELIEKKSLIIQKIKLKKKQKETQNLNIKTKEAHLQHSKSQKKSENLNKSKAPIEINQNNNGTESNSSSLDNEEQNHQIAVQAQIQAQAQKSLEGDLKSLQNKITAFLKQNKKQRQLKSNQNKNSQLNFQRQNTKDNQEIIQLIAHIEEPKTKESQPKLLRNESMQFKKNKLINSTTKSKQSYTQIYSERKVPQKFQLIDEYQKSQSLSQQTEEFYFQESIKDLSKKKQSTYFSKMIESILLVEDIGEAISVDEGQNQQQINGSTRKSSLNGSIGSISLKQIPKQMSSSKQFQRSFESQPVQSFGSSYPKKNSIDDQSSTPELMLSQQSSMSRKQIEDRYKASVKNAKLSQKLKSKKRN